MHMFGDLSQKKTIVALSLLIAIILLAFLGLRYLDTGTITITSNVANADITLTQVSANADTDGRGMVIKVFFGRGTLSKNVTLGRYVASVQNSSTGTMQVINLDSHTKFDYKAKLIAAKAVEPVTYQDAEDIAANQYRLLYLNGNDQHLYQIDSSNQLSIIAPDIAFQGIQWASADLGIGEASSGQMYLIKNTAVTPLKMPFSPSANSKTLYAIASNGQMYLSNGTDVYTAGMAGNFKKLYAAKGSTVNLFAGPNEVYVNQLIGSGEGTTQVIAVSVLTGKASMKNYSLAQAAWSPNGQYIASTTETGGVIYDTKNNSSTVIPYPNSGTFIGNLSWSGNQTILYTTGGNEIWTYNITAQRAQLLAELPVGTDVSVSGSNDGAYAYLATGANASFTAIQRIGLQGQKASATAQQLESIVSSENKTCAFGLLNFAPPPSLPVLLVHPTSDNESNDCTQIINAELQTSGLTSAKVDIQETATIPVASGQ